MQNAKREETKVDALSSRKRRRLLPQETEFLIHVFEQCPRPSTQVRDYLAARLGMSARNIQIWFQNRRAKVKRDFVESNGKTMLLFAPHSVDLQTQSLLSCLQSNFAMAIRPHIPSSDTLCPDTHDSFEAFEVQPAISNRLLTHEQPCSIEQFFQSLPANLEDARETQCSSIIGEDAFSMSSASFDHPLFSDMSNLF